MNQPKSLIEIWFLYATMAGFMSAFIMLVSYCVLPIHFEPVLDAPESDYLFYGLLAFASMNAVLILFFFDSLAERTSREGGVVQSAADVRKGRFFAKIAMSEAISIYGLVFFIVAGSMWRSLLFCAISFFLLLRLYPSDESATNS